MKRHLVCAAIAVLLFGLPLLWSLQTAIPYRVRQTLAPDASGGFAAVELPELAYLRTSDGQSTYKLRLLITRPQNLIRNPEIELRLTDYGQTRTILSAEVSIPAGNCAYAARADQVLPRNGLLLFSGRERCADLANATKSEAFLTLRLNKPGKPAVWTVESAKGTPSETALLIADRTRGYFSGRMVTGAVGYTDQSRTATRLTLLAYVWQLPRSALAIVILGAIALIGLSAALLSRCCIAASETRRSVTLPTSLAVASAAFALAAVYAVIVPPLEAADEPNHFVGLSYLLKRPALARESFVLGQIGHLDRIAFHPDEHFNPSDVGHPVVTFLMAGGEPDWNLRGKGVLAVWHAFAPLLRHTKTVSGTLLLARVLDAVVFATAAGLFVGIVATFGPSKWPALDAFPLFIIPTLPFFGMFLSNYAPLCAVYVLFTAAIVVFVWDDRTSYVSGPLMGLSWAAAVLISRSAFPLAVVLMSCAAARIIVGPRLTNWLGALVFWMGLAVPSSLAFSMIPQHLFETAQRTAAAVPLAIKVSEVLIRLPWLLVLLGVIASAAEMRLHGSRTPVNEQPRQRGERVVAIIGYAGAVTLGGTIALSAFIDYPIAPNLNPQHPVLTRSYVAKMLLAAVTMFRFGQADFLTSQSFWSGYGWLDTFLPDWLVTSLAVCTGGACVIMLIWIARTRAYRTGVSCFLVIFGLVAAFMAAAFTVLRATPADLHGRYLLGIYLCLITLFWHWLPRTIPKARWRTAVVVLCGLCVIAIHGLAFATILSRYFG